MTDQTLRCHLAYVSALSFLRGYGSPLENGWMVLERTYLRSRMSQKDYADILMAFEYAKRLGGIELRKRNEYRIIHRGPR